jgi:pyruvate dehydrogenase E2 component (dihydrolipoamide acetyltransferase)
MTELKQFRLPDVGEGLTEADIVSWRVKPGDTVTVNQVIVEIETAKAVVELPSPYDGVVAQLLVDEGQTVEVGTPIIAVDTSGAASENMEQPLSGPAQDAPARQPVLVGYGVKTAATTRRARKTSPSSPMAASTASTAPAAAPPAPAPATATPVKTGPTATAVRDRNGGGRALAKPPVRKLARDLGVDLSQLSGTGPAGSITRDDIQQAVDRGQDRSIQSEKAVRAGTGATAAQPASDLAAPRALPREERVPVRGVRKRTAEAMVGSAFTAPHVTEFLEVDVTGTMAALARVRTLPEFDGLRVSPLLFVARALLTAIARHPMINSSWDSHAQEIVVKHYVNLGFAAATERGLLVPNIKDAQALPLPGLARAFGELTATARDGRCTPADLTGGTITITNVGVFGVDAGTPILTPGEAAILAFGRIREAPWVHDGQLAVRQVTTLSLSFDHRIVDGELGSAVLRDLGQMLEDPVRMLAWA